MKKIRFLPLIMFLAAGIAFAQDEEYKGMNGTAKPSFQKSSDTGTCFIFREYVVKTTQNEGEGENVAVYKQKSTTNGESGCKTTGEPNIYIEDFANNSFFGISGAYFFIDTGTSVESRELLIYSLATGDSIMTESYSGDPKVTEGRFVIFDSPSDKKGPLATCKEAAKWKREGGGVGWVQGKKLDLQTLKKVSVGGLRCVYMQ